MTRLIDADSLMYAVDGNPLTTDSLKEYVRSTVKAQLTVDAVEVVRCKDCIFNHAKDWVDCFNNGMFGRTTDNFCSRGERRKNEETE